MEMGMGGMGMERVFPCVRLRGLPFDVTEDEIRIFLVRHSASGVANCAGGVVRHLWGAAGGLGRPSSAAVVL
jgi:hypothetical protein